MRPCGILRRMQRVDHSCANGAGSGIPTRSKPSRIYTTLLHSRDSRWTQCDNTKGFRSAWDSSAPQSHRARLCAHPRYGTRSHDSPVELVTEVAQVGKFSHCRDDVLAAPEVESESTAVSNEDFADILGRAAFSESPEMPADGGRT